MNLTSNLSNEQVNVQWCTMSGDQGLNTSYNSLDNDLLTRRLIMVSGTLIFFLFLFLMRRPKIIRVMNSYQMEETGTVSNNCALKSGDHVSVDSICHLETMKKKIAIQDEMLKKLIVLEFKLTELENILISKYGDQKLPTSS